MTYIPKFNGKAKLQTPTDELRDAVRSIAKALEEDIEHDNEKWIHLALIKLKLAIRAYDSETTIEPKNLFDGAPIPRRIRQTNLFAETQE